MTLSISFGHSVTEPLAVDSHQTNKREIRELAAVQQILLADDRGGSESAEPAITLRGLFSDIPSSGPQPARELNCSASIENTAEML